MNSLILRTAAGFLLSILLLFSIFLLVSGHNNPGGGFVGGLMAAGAFVLWLFAFGLEDAQKILIVRPQFLIAAGLLNVVVSGCIALFFGKPFMTGVWYRFKVPGLIDLHMGTPVLFDIGVYLLVLGVTLTIVMVLYYLERNEGIS